MNYQSIEGGVCAAEGFQAGAVHCGIRKNRSKKDLALIVSAMPAAAAAIYTKNKVKGAPILVSQKHLENGIAQAIVCNSGNANTCNADGVYIAEQMCQSAAQALGIPAEDIVISSTGVIGEPLPLEPIKAGMAPLAASLASGTAASWSAAEAIMTTDTKVKQAAVSFALGGKPCKLGGICKGSGMIHPNMATMLCFVTSDAKISPEMLRKICKEVADETFHMISVDGDTSTNDTLAVLANGMAGNEPITGPGEDYEIFKGAMMEVCRILSREMAADGEGATHLIECVVSGAPDKDTARKVAKSVICSSLVKSAVFGADANWGRVLCAVGYAEADFAIDCVDVSLSSPAGCIQVCVNGAGVDFSEEQAKKILLEKEIGILINMKQGSAEATAWGCDLTYDYVKINGDYRT